jgi:RNA polymerase-binding transcription factor DksA
MSAPDRIWTASTYGKCHVGFDTPSMNYTNEYIRKDASDAAIAAARAEIAELKRQLGGGCDANHGNEHRVMKDGTYAYCANCGESLRGIRFVHLPPVAAEAQP